MNYRSKYLYYIINFYLPTYSHYLYIQKINVVVVVHLYYIFTLTFNKLISNVERYFNVYKREKKNIILLS